MSKPPSKSVFIGNIPYGLTEEQITDIFSSAGKVINFRLVYDRETGRPKGFGFAEYPDSDSAASAVRNLNDYEIMNRKLRVDFSNDGAEDETAVPANYSSYPPPPQNGVAVPLPIISSQNGSGLPQLPQGVELPQGLSCPDAISRTLGTLPPAQLLDVLSQMKQLVAADPAKATELLKQAPQLSYAIFQALLLMGLVSTEALASVVEQAAGPPPMPTVQAPTPQHSMPSPYAPPPPGQGFQGYPPQLPQYGNVSTPPVPHGLQYPPPPQQYQPPRQPEPAPPTLGADTDALIKQALEIPLEVIEQLPPGEKAQLLALRATFGR